MKLKVMQEKIYDGLRIVQGAVSKKTTLPILNGILLEFKKDKGIHLTGTDLEIGIETWINTDIKEGGAIVLPAKNIAAIIRELPNEIIDITVNLENYKVTLKCMDSKFVINGYNPDEFPALPKVDNPVNININSNKFLNIIEEVKFSTAVEETQPALTGALMVIDNNLIKMVSTNTYRLSYSQRKISENIDKNIKVILPGKTLNELSSLLSEEDKVRIQINSNYASFQFSDITVISRLIEGQFPNYEQVMPDEYNTSISVNRADFKKAVKRASLIARQDSNIISLKISESGKLIINSMDSDTGSAHEELTAECRGPEQNINIDADYLLDVLKVINEDDVNLDFVGSLNPLTIKKIKDEDKFIYLIMPVRPDV